MGPDDAQVAKASVRIYKPRINVSQLLSATGLNDLKKEFGPEILGAPEVLEKTESVARALTTLLHPGSQPFFDINRLIDCVTLTSHQVSVGRAAARRFELAKKEVEALGLTHGPAQIAMIVLNKIQPYIDEMLTRAEGVTEQQWKELTLTKTSQLSIYLNLLQRLYEASLDTMYHGRDTDEGSHAQRDMMRHIIKSVQPDSSATDPFIAQFKIELVQMPKAEYHVMKVIDRLKSHVETFIGIDLSEFHQETVPTDTDECFTTTCLAALQTGEVKCEKCGKLGHTARTVRVWVGRAVPKSTPSNPQRIRRRRLVRTAV